jgi:hypothetical protein
MNKCSLEAPIILESPFTGNPNGGGVPIVGDDPGPAPITGSDPGGGALIAGNDQGDPRRVVHLAEKRWYIVAENG